MDSYRVLSSSLIIDNYDSYVKICDHIKSRLADDFPDAPDSTWIFRHYNFFSYGSTYTLMYDLYKELTGAIRHYVGDNRRIWLQAWLNYLTYDEVEKVLSKHHHEWDMHGYISIDPKNTATKFNTFSIENKIGNIYLGPGGDKFRHCVKNKDKWSGNRITIGFDCTFKENLHYSNMLIPVL